jgi:hypothetical protein
MCVGQRRNLLNQETKKIVNFMLDDRRFVTEAGKLTTEREENEFEKCAHRKDGTKKSRW